MIEFKENMVKKLQKKTEGEYNGLTKDINSVRAVTNTLAHSLGEEGTKTTENLKRQMVETRSFFLMEMIN